jgi:PIN domain nuclease of toxin-antitoxin system
VGVTEGVLLDTHTFVWAASDPNRLGAIGLALIENPTTVVYVSAASAWEIATKVRLGEFPAADPIVEQFDDIATQLRAELLPITSADALGAGSMRWDHRDPFDRMLAAQAMLSDLTLITRDQTLHDLAGLSTAW